MSDNGIRQILTAQLYQSGSNRTNNIDGAEAGFGCPTMQYSSQDASRNNSIVMKTNHRQLGTCPPPELPMAPSIG